MKKKDTIVSVQSRASVRKTLSDYTKSTLGSGDLRGAVRLPDGEEANEWFAANIADFFNEISLIFGLCHENAQKFNKPGEGFPSGFEYRWADGKKNKKPIQCSSTEYVDYVMTWVQNQINNEDIFPVEATHDFPKDFKETIVRDIFRRLFRIFAIIFWSHFDALKELEATTHLNTVFKHFMYFVFEFNLIDKKELKPLAKPVERLRKDFEGSS